MKAARKVALKFDAHEILSRAVEEGVRLGYRRAHKHTDEPSEETIVSHVELAVMESLSEVVRW